MVDEVRNRRLRLAGRQMVGDRRGRAEGHPVLLVGRPGRRDRAEGHPVLLAGRRVRAEGHRGLLAGRPGRRIGAVDHRAPVGGRRGRGMGRRGRVVVHSARAGRVVARMERVCDPPDAVPGERSGGCPLAGERSLVVGVSPSLVCDEVRFFTLQSGFGLRK